MRAKKQNHCGADKIDRRLRRSPHSGQAAAGIDLGHGIGYASLLLRFSRKGQYPTFEQ